MPVEIKKYYAYQGHREPVYALACAGGKVYSAGGDGGVIEWNPDAPDTAILIAKVNHSVYSMLNLRNLLIIGENFGGLHVLDMESREERQSLKIDSTYLFDIQLVKGNLWVVGAEGLFMVITPQMQVLHRGRLSRHSARCIQPIPGRNEVAIGCSDHSIKIVNQDSFQIKTQLKAHTNSVFTVGLSPNEKYLVSGGRDAKLKVWEVENYQLQHDIPAHMFAVNHLDFSPCGRYFVTCSMDKTLKVWNASSFRLLKVIDKARHAGHGTSVNKVQWFSENQIASCSDDRAVSVWTVNITP